MTKQIIITLSEGDFNRGFPASLRIKDESKGGESQYSGKLPPAPSIPDLLQEWQTEFHQKIQPYSNTNRGDSTRIKAGASKQFSVTDRALELEQVINNWLNNNDREWQSIRDALLRSLQPEEEARLIIASNDRTIWQIPWYAWNILKKRYQQLEVAIALPTYEHQPLRAYPRQKIRILAIIGDSEGIDVNLDRQILDRLSNREEIELKLLVEPNRETCDRELWDDRGWDILFFAGHSKTDTQRGILYINSQASIPIDALEFALKSAIEKGLHLALFNSCDGMGIARALPSLNLPLAIVMREPINDDIAASFLDNFLQAFSRGKSLYLSLREARERLQGLEDKIPNASWLPVLHHNPAIAPLSWQQLSQRLHSKTQINTPQLDPNPAATRYLNYLQQKWQTLGCLDVKTRVVNDELEFGIIARFSDFKILDMQVVEMRGDAFFIAAVFDNISFNALQHFSQNCIRYAQQNTKNSVLEQIYNARVPSNLCFAIAVVDRLEDSVKQQIRTSNPIDHRLYANWYEIPLVYVLEEERVYFFDSPSFWDKFKGEVVWHKIREFIIEYTSRN